MKVKTSPFAVVVICLGVFCVGNAKKVKNAIPDSEPNRKFRMGKVNQVWEKALKMKLSPDVMGELSTELEQYDQALMEHKRSKTKQDDDGIRAGELIDELHKIMEKYGMFRKVKPVVASDSSDETRKRFHEDPKLNKLWQTANKHGKFSEDELKALELEFYHHKQKLQEYEILKSEVSKMDDISDNAVEKQLNLDDTKAKKEKMSELKSEIDEGLERLHLKTKQGTLSADSVPFTEPRVAELWEEAKKGNFTDEELESIKEELHHFQTRVEKHLFFRDQLKNSVEKLSFHGGEESVSQQHKDTHNHLKNKVQDLGAKVKKLHHELSRKLSSGSKERSEL